MAVQIQIRRDTAANWTNNDPTLASGEFGVETDTGKFKIGDGSTAWTALDYADAAIDHDDLVNFAANEHYLQSTITAVGTIATGVWEGTDVGIAHGGSGQSTAQAAIDALTAVSGGTNEHVLTKDTATGNAKWKAAVGGGVGFGRPIILTPQSSCGPASDFATQDTIAGGSTPNEVVSVLDFDPDASEYADFKFALPAGYEDGGLTVTVVFSMTSDHDEGTPHKVRWEVAFARIDDDGIAISADHAYAFNGVGATVPSVLTEVSYDNITFTDGADMDSLAAGEMAILRIYRDHDHGDDNATGDAELQMIMIKET